jgi:hypothetical protein
VSGTAEQNGSTPIEGVPLIVAASPEVERHDEDTDVVSLNMSNAIAAGTITPQQLLESVSDKVADRLMARGVGNGGNGNGRGGKTFLGFRRTELIKYAVSAVLAIGAFLFVWYQTVNKSIEERATIKEVEQQFEDHSSEPHKMSAPLGLVKDIDTRVRKIEIQQTMMQRDVEHIGKGVDEIKKEMRRPKRYRRR